MAASKRLPYRSYYYLLLCVVFFRFSGYSAIQPTNEGCVASTILTQIIFGFQERARWRRCEWL